VRCKDTKSSPDKKINPEKSFRGGVLEDALEDAAPPLLFRAPALVAAPFRDCGLRFRPNESEEREGVNSQQRPAERRPHVDMNRSTEQSQQTSGQSDGDDTVSENSKGSGAIGLMHIKGLCFFISGPGHVVSYQHTMFQTMFQTMFMGPAGALHQGGAGLQDKPC